MNFHICGLPVEPFLPLFGLDDAALAQYGARRYIADSIPGFPCRVTLEDAQPGEPVLLVNYVHQPADSPYRSSHAVFVRERPAPTLALNDDVPAMLRRRLLSVRAFDDAGMMLDADITEGTELEALIERFFANDAAAYLHVHFAKRGCYAARIERAK